MVPRGLRPTSLVAVCLLCAGAVFPAPDSVESRVDTPLKLLLRARPGAASLARLSVDRAQETVRRLAGRSSTSKATSAEAAMGVSARLLVLVKYVGDAQALEATGFRIEGRISTIYTGTIKEDRLAELAGLPGVVFVQLSQRLSAPPVPAPSPRAGPSQPTAGVAEPDSTVNVPAEGLSGSGAVVAYVDTGVDVFHEDFRKADGTTRIRYLLDLSSPGDVDGDGVLDGSGPFGGTLYDEASINVALASGRMAARDTTGHGTHGLSVAAGDDPALPGVAPAADLIVVKATREDGTLGFESADIINALSFVDQKAVELGRPYVANLSLGSIGGSHDGRSLEEQAIDALVGPGIAGKVVVVAAGNASDNRGTRNRHFRGTAYAGFTSTSNSHTLVVPAYTENPGRGNDRVVLTLWQKGRDQNRITVTGPGCPAVSADFGDYQDVPTPCGDVFIANMGGASPLNGDVESVVLIDDWSGTSPRSGSWTVTVTGQEIGDTGVYDGWLGEESVVGSTSPYLTTNADNALLVGKPGGAYNAITVGSQGLDSAGTRYRTSWTDVNGVARTDTSAVDGDISDFSSPGGTRDGRVKPELVAPGERVLGAVSRDALPAASTSIYRFHPFAEPDALLTDESSNHAFGMLQGTSFAAPVVSGLVARVLGENPALDAVQVRNVLLNSATVDSFVTASGTRAVPNGIWGYGKVLRTLGTSPLPSNLRITTDTAPSGFVGEPYGLVFTASGGRLPYVWSLSAGALPPGLTRSGSYLSGTPTTAGTFTFTIRVQDSTTPTPQVATQAYPLSVSASLLLDIATPALPPARLSRAYGEQLAAVGGTAPYAWTVVGGSLPAGLSLTAAGFVQGVPTGIEKATFTVRATDAASATAYKSYSLRVLGLGGDDWTALGRYAPTVNQIAVDPNDSSRVFASTRSLDGIFMTTDGGDSWQPVGTDKASLGFFNRSAEHIRISPSTSAAFIIETGYRMADAGNVNQRWVEHVFRYDPALDDWVKWGFPCAADDPAFRLDALDIDPSGNLLVLSNGINCSSFPEGLTQPRLVRSVDQGANWTSPGGLPAAVGSNDKETRGSLSVAGSDPSRMYASRTCRTVSPCDTPEGTFASSNGGASWTDVTASVTQIVDVRASAANPLDVLRAGTTFVERSLDGGATWSRFSVPVGTGSVVAMDRSATAPQLVLAGATTGLFKSEDHGQTWTELRVAGRSFAVTTVSIDPSDDNRLWVGDSQGVFSSVDRGSTWSLRNGGLVQRTLKRVAISPAANKELILTGTGGPYLSRTEGQRWVAISGAGGGDGYWVTAGRANPNRYYSVPLFYGLWRSNDRGVTWYQPNPNFGNIFLPSGEWVGAFAMSPFNENTLLVNLCASAQHSCTTAGARLYRSLDGGVSWTSLPGTGIDAAARVFELAFARDVQNRVYLATSAGVYRSSDGGTTWALYGAGVHPTIVQAMAVAPSDSNYLYAGSSFFDPAVGSWQTSSLPNPQSLAVDPQNPLVAYAGGVAGSPTLTGLHKTTDGGRTWNQVSAPYSKFSVMSVAVDPNRPAVIYVATRSAGVFRSGDNGATWTELSEYGTVADLVNVSVEDPSNSNLLLAGTAGYGVQASTNKGLSFVPRVTGLGNLYVNGLAFDPDTPSRVYAATDGGLYVSANSGGSWAATTVLGRVTDVATHNDGTAHRVWATVAGQGVAYSGNGGSTFAVYSSGLESLQLTGLEVESLGVAHRVWATTSGGSGVAYSDDEGQSWRSAAGNGLTDRDVSDLAITTGTAHRVWATTASGVYFSADAGTTWNSVSSGLPSGTPVTSVAVDPNSQEVLVSLSAKESGGVFRGASATGVWTAYNGGLDERRVRRISRGSSRTVDVSTKATSFYAATAGGGVFASELRSVSSVAPTITTALLTDATLKLAYQATIQAAGGTPPYRWSVVGSPLPPGLALDPVTGQITGVPGQAGVFAFAIQVTDAALKTSQRVLTLRVIDPTPTLSVGDAAVSALATGTTTARVPVTLSPASNVTVSVGYQTADGTALADSHYLASSGTLSFSPGQTSQTIPVTVKAVTLPKVRRSFYLNLKSPVNAPISRDQGVVTITDGDLFFTLSPCRLVDTRAGDTPAIAGGETRSFTLSGLCGIPISARALALNVTVTSPTTGGHLTLFPAGGSIPPTSTINFGSGQTRANNAIIRIDGSGRLSVSNGQPSGSVQVILDVTGYFE